MRPVRKLYKDKVTLWKLLKKDYVKLTIFTNF